MGVTKVPSMSYKESPLETETGEDIIFFLLSFHKIVDAFDNKFISSTLFWTNIGSWTDIAVHEHSPIVNTSERLKKPQ